MNILLTISYDGTNYSGWQIQKNSITVQEMLEKALSNILKNCFTTRGSSRTDTGVHADGQLVLLKTETTIPVDKITYAINSFLPLDIVVTNACVVSDDFHPQYSVYKKTYEYKILNSKFKFPKLVNYTEYVRDFLDIEKMKLASEYFVGTYDFKAFCASGSQAQSTIRTIYEINVKKDDNIISVVVTGNGFLYNMVRIIVGTLIEVGLNRINPNDIYNIIQSKDRKMAGKTVSANGLTLKEIFWR